MPLYRSFKRAETHVGHVLESADIEVCLLELLGKLGQLLDLPGVRIKGQ